MCSPDEPPSSGRTQSNGLPPENQKLDATVLGLEIYLGCVESWTGEDLLTSDTFFYPLLYIRPGDNQMVLEAILGLCVHLLLYW